MAMSRVGAELQPVHEKEASEPMQIHWTDFDSLSEAQRDAVERRLAALADERDDLIAVRLVARATQHHRLGGRQVRIVCQARGAEIVASCERPEIGQALDEAVDDFEREVRRARERRRARWLVS
jgi:ribosome-associated translation inhibitor RaiA